MQRQLGIIDLVVTAPIAFLVALPFSLVTGTGVLPWVIGLIVGLIITNYLRLRRSH